LGNLVKVTTAATSTATAETTTTTTDNVSFCCGYIKAFVFDVEKG
jgi:hypothetical protein